MANTTITKILFRRGPEADRTKVTPTMGEPLFTIDTHKLYVGDGTEAGGWPIVDVDTGIFSWKEADPDNPGQLKTSAADSTSHQKLSLSDDLNININTTGQIKSSNPGSGCDDTAAIVASAGGIYSFKDIHCKADVVSFCSSDERLKDNVLPLEDSLTKIDILNGVTFTWNDQQDTYIGDDTGLLAQDVEQLALPGLVDTRDDGFLAIKYEKVIPLLVECVKELKEKVQQLEKKLDE